MKVPLHIVLARRERLAQIIEQHRYLPVKELCRRLGVSEATLRRDLGALVEEKRITRTYGGALQEFNDRFPSFRERQGQGSQGKGEACQERSEAHRAKGPTSSIPAPRSSRSAEAFRAHPVTPVTIVTSNLPVGEMLARFRACRSFNWPGNCCTSSPPSWVKRRKRVWNSGTSIVAFLSAEGMDPRGPLEFADRHRRAPKSPARAGQTGMSFVSMAPN